MKKRFQPHFRKVKNAKFTGHPVYVFEDREREYDVLGITGAPKTNGMNNVPLRKNPEPGNARPAYLRPKPDREKKGAFGERLKGWKFSPGDKKKVDEIIDRHRKTKK